MAKTSTARKNKSGKGKATARRKVKMPKRKPAKAKAKKATKKPARKSTAKKTVKKARPNKAARAIVKKNVANGAGAFTTAALTPSLKIGDQAPGFTLNDQNGNTIALSDFLGKKVVLYFYPKDDTPGCTKEACSFRDHIQSFITGDTVILGVSFDDQGSHKKFEQKYGLNFPILSDTTKETAKAYGVYVQKNMYGNISWGIQRATFVIDREGKIAQIFPKVSVDGHTEEVLEALRQMA